MSNLNFSVLIEAQAKETGEIRCSKKAIGCEGLPSGGLVQVNHVLLIEALRSECYVMLLSRLSLGESLSEITPKTLAEQVDLHLMEVLKNILPEVAAETLKRTTCISP